MVLVRPGQLTEEAQRRPVTDRVVPPHTRTQRRDPPAVRQPPVTHPARPLGEPHRQTVPSTLSLVLLAYLRAAKTLRTTWAISGYLIRVGSAAIFSPTVAVFGDLEPEP